MSTNILSLSSDEALDFVLKSQNYCTIEVPEYIDFNPVLDFVRSTISNSLYEDCILTSPNSIDNLNVNIQMNKDGKYSTRPITIINPYLYYFWAREICAKENWCKIQNCFAIYHVPNIEVSAITVIPNKNEKFHNSSSALNWWRSIEQRSLELSLEYRYMFTSDIRNCYGTINPRSIERALTIADTGTSINENLDLAKRLSLYIQYIQGNEASGLPQGNVLSDITAEIILGYSDLLLSTEIEKARITSDYKILRYRDDYRIFCNDKDELIKISYLLQQVLRRLNFDMNSQKTKISDDLIVDSIKPDKLWYIFNTPISNKNGYDFDSLQKHLLYILQFSRKYPNGGQIKTMLSELVDRIDLLVHPKINLSWESVNLDDLENSHQTNIDTESTKVYDIINKAEDNIFNNMKKYKEPKNSLIKENIKVLCAISTQIAIENVACSHYALELISKLISSVNDIEKKDLLLLIRSKVLLQPNSQYLELWLQNMTYQIDKGSKTSPYTLSLCKIVAGNNVDIWNTSWLKLEYTRHFPLKKICISKVLKEARTVITFKERRKYDEL